MKAVLVVTAALLWISAAKVGASPVLCLTLRATWAACNVDELMLNVLRCHLTY